MMSQPDIIRKFGLYSKVTISICPSFITKMQRAEGAEVSLLLRLYDSSLRTYALDSEGFKLTVLGKSFTYEIPK